MRGPACFYCSKAIHPFNHTMIESKIPIPIQSKTHFYVHSSSTNTLNRLSLVLKASSLPLFFPNYTTYTLTCPPTFSPSSSSSSSSSQPSNISLLTVRYNTIMDLGTVLDIAKLLDPNNEWLRRGKTWPKHGTNPFYGQMPADLMRRPGFGTAGNKHKVNINAYNVDQWPSRSVYQYDVSIYY